MLAGEGTPPSARRREEKNMPDKFKGGGYSELITPLNEEGNRTSNDPDTANVPSDINPPDPMGIAHGLDRGGKTAKGGKVRRSE
jgi:hypothetical protein